MAFGCHRPVAQSGPAGSPFLFKMGPSFRRFFSPPPSSPSSEGEYGSEINSLDPDGWCNCMTVTEAARLSCHFAFLLSSRARSCSPTLLRAHFPLAFAHLKEFDEERLMPHSAFYNRIPCSGASVSHSGPLYPIPLSLSAVYPLVTWPPLLLQCSRASLPPQQATGPPRPRPWAHGLPPSP